MFNKNRIINLMVLMACMHLSIVSAKMLDRFDVLPHRASDTFNAYRVRQSSIATPPKNLHLNRHLFLVSGVAKQVGTVNVEIQSKQGAEANKTIVKMQADLESARTKLVKQEPALHFNWDMTPPVKTPIAKQFGHGAAKLSKGVIYNIYTNQIVYAPIAGEVIFAGPMAGFGYVVMIEKDFENIVLIAGVSNMNVKQGSRLYRGQKIGSVIKGEWIYLEIRHEGIPVDPKLVLISG